MIIQPSFYAVIPATVRYDKRICANAKLLFGEITALCQKEGYCWAPDSYFAELYQSTERTVKRWISSLVDSGYLRRVVLHSPKGDAVGRRLYLPEALPSTIDLVSGGSDKNVTTPTEGGSDKNVTTWGQNCHHNITNSNNKTDRQTDIEDCVLQKQENIEESASACVCEEEALDSMAENQEAVSEYISVLQDVKEDVLDGLDARTQGLLVDMLLSIGSELAAQSCVTIHGRQVASKDVLSVFTRGLQEGADSVFLITFRQVMAAVLSGRVKNQFGYIVSTLYTRLMQGGALC